MIRAIAILLLMESAAFAQQCPPDKPLAKSVVDFTKSATCTTKACAGRLTCEAGTGKCAIAATECNTCTWSETTICISQEEFDRAAGVVPGTIPR